MTDELLNKYLDGELSREQAEKVRAELQSSDALNRKFKALKLVHEKLSLLNEDEVSQSFTESLMKQIARNKFVIPKQQKYFITSVVTFITLLCLVIFGFSISAMISEITSTASDSQFVFNSVSGLSTGLVRIIQQLFSGSGLSIIGSIFSLIILISGYFFFEMQKRTKAHLRNGQ